MFTSGLTERDVNLIRAIEWLTMSVETAGDAIVKANDVGRYFLCELPSSRVCRQRAVEGS
jgi:hypothetical protein